MSPKTDRGQATRKVGCARDSPASDEEHLMIMFYDLLLLDDIVCVHEQYDQRRRRLWATLQRIPGRVDIGGREKIDFRLSNASARLADRMAYAITQGWEGLVMKDCQAPYFSLDSDEDHIKPKKDYIPGLGDSADLVIVGGRRDAKAVQALHLGNLSWTTFYLACLINTGVTSDLHTRPKFHIVGRVERLCISVQDVRYLNEFGKLCQVLFARKRCEMEVQVDLPRMEQPTEPFKRPLVVEVIGAGFDRPSNVRFFTLRFPRVVKVHRDRDVGEALDFAQYQRLAERCRANTLDGDDQIKEAWLMKLHPSTYVDHSSMKTSSLATSATGPPTSTHSGVKSIMSQQSNSKDSATSGIRDASKKRSLELDSITPPASKQARQLAETANEDTETCENSSMSDYGPSMTETRDGESSYCLELANKRDYHGTQPTDQSPKTCLHDQSSLEQPTQPSMVQILGPLLVDESVRNLPTTNIGDLLSLFMTYRLETTFNSRVFWKRLVQREMRYFEAESSVQCYLVLVNWSEESLTVSAMKCLLVGLESERNLREAAISCTVIFMNWRFLKKLPNKKEVCADQCRSLAKASIVINKGKVVLTNGTES